VSLLFCEALRKPLVAHLVDEAADSFSLLGQVNPTFSTIAGGGAWMQELGVVIPVDSVVGAGQKGMPAEMSGTH
jgi:hypothetical protein